MIINLYGSTGIIGSKTLNILSKYFPEIKINLLCANNNYKKLIRQTHLYSPKYIYLNNRKKINQLKKEIKPSTKILDFNEMSSYLSSSKSDFSILAISGYNSLNYFDLILKNTSSLGLVSKETIVSAGHLFKKYNKSISKKIYPLDSEHFSIYKFIENNKNLTLNNLTLTASGGPFLGKSFSSLKNVTAKQAANHPKWKMGIKNSIDSATLSNKCLEIIEAHYLFDIPYDKLSILIHPESQIHSIFQYNNYLYNMVGFQNDMTLPLYHFLNESYGYKLKNDKFLFKNNNNFSFREISLQEFPIYKLFKQIDKSNPLNVIKFNVANEYAVNLFQNKSIRYTDIYKIVDKILSLNLNYKLKNIKDIIKYHENLERKIYENNF
mgnify:CR=1 FL=1|tara:strand:+ start:2413 stop:3552 length:1140 start_codon:yes stop_codon:yes gene_type:complete